MKKILTLSFLATVAVALAMAGEATAQVCKKCRSQKCHKCANDGCQCGNGAGHNGAGHNGAGHNGGCISGNCNNGGVGQAGYGQGGYGQGGRGYGYLPTREQIALSYPWHCNYYHAEWGSPVALVVPPTAEKQWNMGWGVANDRLSRIYHQFGRAYPGDYVDDGSGGQRFQPTPRWPSDTSQFGVYYVRGPW